MPQYVNYGYFSLFFCCRHSQAPSITWFPASWSIGCTVNSMLHTWQMITSFNSTQSEAVPRFHPSSSSEEKDSLELILCLLNQACIFFFFFPFGSYQGSSPGGSESKASAYNAEFNPWVAKIPWRRKWHPTLVLLPGKSHGRRSLVGCSPWGR